MEKQLYRFVFMDAWHTVWTHKRLWFWGLFAALLGNAGEYQLLLTAVDRSSGKEFAPSVLPPTGPVSQVEGLWTAATNDPFSVFFLLFFGLLVIGLTLFFVWLSMVSVAALVRGTVTIDEGGEAPTLADGVREGSATFGSVLIPIVLGRVINWFLLSLIVMFATLAVVDYLVGLPVFLVGFIVLVPVLFIVSFIVRLTVIDVIVKRRPLFASLDQAIDIFRQHWLITAELAFFLFVLTTLAGIIMVSILFITAIPVFISALVLWELGLGSWSLLLAVLGIVLFFMVVLPIGALISAYQWAAWTHLYMRLKERGHVSKLVRVASKIFGDRPVAVRR